MLSRADDGSSPASPGSAPRALVAVAPHTRLKSFDGKTPGRGKRLYVVRELREALLDSYPTDAHLVAYVVEGWARQFRIMKRAWQDVGAPVTVNVFLADIDTPDHGPWSEAFVTRIVAAFDSHPALAHAGLYFTKHGCRIVQPIDRAIPVADVEPHIEAWLDRLEAAGLHDERLHHLDRNCRDWTRHFRLPNVRRDGVDYRSPILRLERMAPVPPPPARPRQEAKRKVPRPRRAPASGGGHGSVALEWKACVPILARACARVADGRHELYLALAGALVDKGAPLESLPSVLRAVATATGNDTNIRNRENCGETTVERVRANQPIKGYGSLRLHWPAVADALDLALTAAAQPSPPQPVRPIAEVESELRGAIADAPDGVTLVSAECGLGKTRALLEVAAERAARTHASEAAKGNRAPMHSKTVISVDKHELALQVVADLARLGVEARRIFGPLSLEDEAGERVCKKHHVALPLVEGGQSMRYELCEGRGIDPCEHAATCAATTGCEGPEDARVTVGVHALLPQLVREAGTTGLLGIDEPPPLVETVAIAMGDLALARAEVSSFDGIFAAALRPALSALEAWLRHCPSAEPAGLRDAIQAQRWPGRDEDLAWARAATQEGGDDLAAFARAAVSEEHHRTGPPLKWAAIEMAKSSTELARRIGCASRVLHTLHATLTTTSEVKLHAELDGAGPPVAIVTRVRESLSRALNRVGSTVVLDANAALNAPLYAKAIGYDAPMHTFAAPDGAPIERTLIRSSKATRSGWLDGDGDLDPMGGSFRKALEAAMDWALEDPDAHTLAIITMKAIRELLEDSLRPENASGLEARYDGRRSLLSDARWLLAPTLRRWPGTLLWGHYGAVRGLNTMMDADALVTLGDPRPNVNQVANDLVLLGIDDPQDRRVDKLARAELEQAHGRLRACRRTRPARALHVGTIIPGGTGWRGDVAFRQLESGRPRNVSEATRNELRQLVAGLGGLRSAARALGCGHSTLTRYLAGTRQPTAEVLDRLRAASRERTMPGWTRNP